MKAAINHLKEGRSPGVDNVSAELLKNPGEVGIYGLLQVCFQIWTTREWTFDGKAQELVVLYKRRNMKECSICRPTVLISHKSKKIFDYHLNQNRNSSEMWTFGLPGPIEAPRHALYLANNAYENKEQWQKNFHRFHQTTVKHLSVTFINIYFKLSSI